MLFEGSSPRNPHWQGSSPAYTPTASTAQRHKGSPGRRLRDTLPVRNLSQVFSDLIREAMTCDAYCSTVFRLEQHTTNPPTFPDKIPS